MSLNLSGISGYDFSGIINSLVQAYKLPENRMVEKKNLLKIQQDAWRDINTRLSALDNTLTALKTASTWTATTVTSTNTAVVTATSDSTAVPGNYVISVTALAQNEIDVSKETDDATIASSMPAYTNPTSTTSNWDFTINGKTVFVQRSAATGSPTLADIRDSINRTQGVGVTASIIQVRTGVYRLSITANKTGQSNQIAYTDPNGTLANALGLTLDASGHVSTQLSGVAGGYTQKAQDASFSVNGVAVTSSTNVLTTAISGVTLTLAGSGTANLTVSSDLTVAQKAVQAFVDQYNSVMDFIATKMSYDSETKKAGELFGDPLLQGIQSRLRSMVGSAFLNPTGPYTLLSQIGISTSGKDASLTFDTAKFAAAVANNPQSVANLFSAPYGGVIPKNDQTTKTYEGVANSLHSYLYPLVQYGGGLSKAQDRLGAQIKDIEDSIKQLDERASAYEERLKIKFAALESLLSELNAQGSWLNSQINALSAYKNK